MSALFIRWSLLLLFLLWSPPSRAWEYLEHQALGKEAYLLACADAKKLLENNSSPQFKQRLDVACGDAVTRAVVFGQLSALAGDHLTSPDLTSVETLIAARSIITYLTLALRNADHFHPEVVAVWRRHYMEALRRAQSARGLHDYMALSREYEGILIVAAFSAHFLQDAFSSGHGGQNRPASSPAAALLFHDYWNEAGRVLLDNTGRCWKSYGDGLLVGEERNSEPLLDTVARGSVNQSAYGLQMVWRPLSATRLAALNVILTFVTGEGSAFRDQVVADTVPIWSLPPGTTCSHLQKTSIADFTCELGTALEAGKCFVCEFSMTSESDTSKTSESPELSNNCVNAYRLKRDEYARRGEQGLDRCGQYEPHRCWALPSVQRPAVWAFSFAGDVGALWGIGEQELGRVGLLTSISSRWANLGVGAGGYLDRFRYPGLQMSMDVGVPLGFLYGGFTALEWVALRGGVYVPLHRNHRIQHEFLGSGVGLNVQLGSLALRSTVLAGWMHSHSLEADGGPDQNSFALDFGLNFGWLSKRAVVGGGANEPPPL